MRGIFSTPACVVNIRLKTTAKAIKLAGETTNNQ